MSGPDPLKPLPSATGVVRAQPDDASFETDFTELAARFTAQSGGGLSPELSADLALEIVLNEIVEQACLATGATGAAIVLPRDGEMVCRASSGSTAPELGARLDTASGLSGECVRTHRTQRCDDAAVDTRADVEASRRLGVRSVMVMPLLQGQELVGVFELFSSQSYAFGDRDEGTLEILAGRTLSNLERAARGPEPPKDVASNDTALNDTASNEAALNAGPRIDVSPEDSLAAPEPIKGMAPEGEYLAPPRGSDLLTWGLGAAVLVCAVLLGVVVGRDLKWRSAAAGPHPVAPRSVMGAGSGVQTPPVAASGTAGTEERASTSPSQTSSAKTSSAKASSTRASSVKASGETAVPPGGLLIYENGKEVFRMPPVQHQEAAASDQPDGMQRASSVERDVEPAGEPEKVVEISPAAAEGSLLHRVEPEYPEAALQQKIQGTVVLEVHIGTDGTVQDVQVVSGPPQLAEASSAAVKQWRFKPRTANGRRVEMQTSVTLNFRLPQ